MRKKRNFKLNKTLLIICGIIFVTMIVTMFFNEKLNYAFHLKPNLTKIESNSMQVHFVDTGEGDVILVRLPNNKNLIVDSGKNNYESKIAYYINNVFFNSQKERVFDYAILTHSDSDHSGNFLYILNNYQVKNFYRPKIYSKNYDTNYNENIDLVIDDANYDEIIKKLNSLKMENKINVFYNFVGAETDEIKEYVTFLSPTKDNYSDENMYSPYIKLEYKNKSVLLTGDATTENEIELINTQDFVNIDVLKLAHHGSNTSTSSTFLEFLNPKYAIISCGENSYGHPSSEVLNNLKNYSEELYNNTYSTQNLGNIIYFINEDSFSDFLFIKDVSTYIFVDYYYIALGIMGVCLIIVFFPKYTKNDNKNNV